MGRLFSPPVLAFIFFIAHRIQQSHCSSIFHRVLLTHALALSASQFVRKKKSPRIYTSMHSGGFELTKLTYTRLEDNLTRHRGDRLYQVLTESLLCLASCNVQHEPQRRLHSSRFRENRRRPRGNSQKDNLCMIKCARKAYICPPPPPLAHKTIRE